MAVQSPLLETSINGAQGVIINITGSLDICLEEVETAAEMVREAAHPEANIIFGAAFDQELDDEIRVTVIATGFESAPVAEEPKKQEPAGIFGKASAAGRAAAAPEEAPVVKEADTVIDEDDSDPFDAIVKIFNNRDR